MGGMMFKSRNKKIALALVTVTLLAGFLFIGAQPRCAAESNDYESIELFTDVLSLVKKSYVEDVDTKKLIYGAIN